MSISTLISPFRLSSMLKPRCFTVVVLLVISCMGATGFVPVAYAQETQAVGPIVRGQARTDGAVWVYHTESLPLGYGFHVYRDAGNGFVRLTSEPVYGASTGPELLDFMTASAYDRLAASLQRTQESRGTVRPDSARSDTSAGLDPHDVLFTIRGDRVRSGIATFLYPGMARALARLYVDDTPPAQTGQVTYRFEFVDAFGESTGETLAGDVSLTPRVPRAPQQLEASNEAHVGRVTWEYPRPDREDYDGVGYFEVYELAGEGETSRMRLNDAPIFRLGNTSTYAYSFEVPFDTTVNVMVEAVDIANQRTAAQLSFTPVDNVPPNQVQNVIARAEEREVELTWDPLGDPDVVGYRVYRSARVDSLAQWMPLHTELLPVYTDTYQDTTIGEQGAQTWFYHVVSVDEEGNEGPPSAAGMGQVEDHAPPDPITNLQAVYDPERDVVRLTWDDDPASDLKTYSVLRRRVRRGMLQLGVQLNTEDLTERSYEDAGPDGRFQEGSTYRYSVAAVDETRNGSERRGVIVEIPDDDPPGAPGRVVAQVDAGDRIVLTWSSSPAVDVAHYVLYRAARGDSLREIVRLPSSGLRFVDRDFEKGETYSYAVQAVDRAGNAGPKSPERTLTVGDGQRPRQVRGVQAVADADGGVTVRWEAVPDDDLVGYRVRRMPIATGIPQPAHEEMIPAGTTQFTDPDGMPGWFYRVTAYDKYGNYSLPSMPEEAVEVR